MKGPRAARATSSNFESTAPWGPLAASPTPQQPTLAPSAFAWSAIFWPAATLRHPMMTFAPCPANTRAASAPIPAAPPVMTTVLPAMSRPADAASAAVEQADRGGILV